MPHGTMYCHNNTTHELWSASNTEAKHYSWGADTVRQPGNHRQQLKQQNIMHLFMCVRLCMNRLLDSWVRRFCFGVLPTTSGERNQTILGEWNQAFKTLGPVTLARELERLYEAFYTIWQSVSQHGALSRVKYLAALPWNRQNGCLESSVDFQHLLVFLVINKPSSVTASAICLLGLINSTDGGK